MYGSLHSGDLFLDFPSLVYFSLEYLSILVKFIFGLSSLSFEILVSNAKVSDRIADPFEFVFRPLDVFVFFLEFSHKLIVVLFGLVEGFLEASVSRLATPHIFLQLFEPSYGCVQLVGELIAFIFDPFAFFLKRFDVDSQRPVFIIVALIFVVQFFDLVPEVLDLGGSSITLSFEVRISPQQFLNH
jgi:hypothetical protein